MSPAGGAASIPNQLAAGDVLINESRQEKEVRSAKALDYLGRSSKKSKIDMLESTGGSVDMVVDTFAAIHETVASPEKGNGVSKTPLMSFKESLIGKASEERVQKEIDEELASDDDEMEGEEDEECPVIRATRVEKIEMRKPWRQTLIIKVM